MWCTSNRTFARLRYVLPPSIENLHHQAKVDQAPRLTLGGGTDCETWLVTSVDSAGMPDVYSWFTPRTEPHGELSCVWGFCRTQGGFACPSRRLEKMCQRSLLNQRKISYRTCAKDYSTPTSLYGTAGAPRVFVVWVDIGPCFLPYFGLPAGGEMSMVAPKACSDESGCC